MQSNIPPRASHPDLEQLRVPMGRRRYRSVSQPDSDNLSKGIFGAFDGLTCVLGVIAAGYVANDMHTLLLAVVGLAIAEGIAMAGGSYLSEMVAVYRMRHALVIGVASAIGIIVPAIPFFFAPKNVAILLSLFLVVCFAIIIASCRVKTLGWLEAYVQTFAIVLLCALVTILVTVLLNGAGV